MLQKVTIALLVTFLTTAGCRGGAARATDFNARGVAAMDSGSVDRAIAAFDSAIAARPDYAEAFRNRGRAYRTKGVFDRALADYDRAIALDSTNAGFYNDRAFAFQMQGQYDRAIADFSHAIARDSTHALAIKNRGRTHFYAGHFAEASADLQRGLVLDSTNAYVAIWLHFVNLHLGTADTARLAQQLARTDTVGWPAPVGRYYLGRLSADSLMRLAPSSDSRVAKDQTCAVAFYVGEQLLAEGRTADATTRFQEARAHCPKSFTEYDGAVAELGRLGAPPR